jgi:hypothetical protein
MAEFVYHCYFNDIGPPTDEDGLLFCEFRSPVEVDVGPLRQWLLNQAWVNPIDGSALAESDITVSPITGQVLIDVDLNKPTHVRKFPSSFILWADWRALMSVHNGNLL